MESLLKLVLSILSVISNGFVLSSLWNWFVMPFGMMNINTAHAIGLMTIISLIRYKHKPVETKTVADLLMTLTVIFLAYGIGYLSHLYMV